MTFDDYNATKKELAEFEHDAIEAGAALENPLLVKKGKVPAGAFVDFDESSVNFNDDTGEVTITIKYVGGTIDTSIFSKNEVMDTIQLLRNGDIMRAQRWGYFASREFEAEE